MRRSVFFLWLSCVGLCVLANLSVFGCAGEIGNQLPEVVYMDGGTSQVPDNSTVNDKKTSNSENSTPDQTTQPEETAPETTADEPAKPVYFADVKPFLQEYCAKCHGGNGGLDVLKYKDASHRLNRPPSTATPTPVEFWQRSFDLIEKREMPKDQPDAMDVFESYRQGFALFKAWKDAGFPETAQGSTTEDPNKGKEDPNILFPTTTTCKGESALPARIWRLSVAQIRNSLEDIFGASSKLPAFTLSETNTGGLIGGFKNGAKEQTLTSVDVTTLVQTFGTYSAEVLANVAEWKDCLAATGDACVRTLATTYGRRLWRRSLDKAEIDKLLLGFTELTAEADRKTGLSYVLERMLVGKEFLFRSELGTPEAGKTDLFRLTPHEVASYLSFFIWQSVPDDTLLDAADNNQLQTLAQIQQQVDRMAKDPRGKRGIITFFYDWLHLHLIQDVNKDGSMFPEVTPTLRQELEESAKMFLSYLIDQKGTLRDVMLSDETFANASIGSLYTDITAQDAELQRVKVDTSKRLGILLSPAFVFAHAGTTSTGFVHRGVFLLEQMMCKVFPSPPPNVNEILAEALKKVDPTKLTQRQKLEQLHSSNGTCNSCHKLIDPVGATFELFDPIGRYRTKEGDLAIDPSGKLLDFGDGLGEIPEAYTNSTEFVQKLASAERFQRCFSMKFYTYSLGKRPEGANNCSLARVHETLQKGGFQLLDLYKAIFQDENFFLRKTNPTAP
ncbi:MAG: DUF1592 domain-containing protein [Myxococcales bacterium]|nr:DUF1592 domain-containing protein [Myxococcales bacterium]